MEETEIVKKNLDLHAEWMRYVFEQPDALDQIPEGAQLVFLPDNDPELSKENQKTADKLKSKGAPVMIIHLDLPKPPEPRIELISA